MLYGITELEAILTYMFQRGRKLQLGLLHIRGAVAAKAHISRFFNALAQGHLSVDAGAKTKCTLGYAFYTKQWGCIILKNDAPPLFCNATKLMF